MPQLSDHSWLFAGPQDDKSRYIRHAVELAIDTRLDFHMDFFSGRHFLFQMRGACVSIDQENLRVYLRGGVDQLPAKGLRVHVYFMLRIDHKMLPCDFESELIGGEWEGADPYVLLSVPPDMGNNQRRHNVRIPISWKDLGQVRFWYAKPSAVSGEKTEWTPIDPEALEICDISAGGIQIALPANSPLLPYLTKGEVMLTDGDFAIRGKNSPAMSILGSVIRRIGEEKDPKLKLGIRFQSWAQMRNDTLTWRQLRQEDGIPALGAWVFQTILERSRLNKETTRQA